MKIESLADAPLVDLVLDMQRDMSRARDEAELIYGFAARLNEISGVTEVLDVSRMLASVSAAAYWETPTRRRRRRVASAFSDIRRVVAAFRMRNLCGVERRLRRGNQRTARTR